MDGVIHLPVLSINRDEVAEVQMVEDARKWLAGEDARREVGVHASDLLDPRLAFWQRIDPRGLTERQVWLFLVGRVLHSFVLNEGDKGGDISASDGGTLNELGILFSPDKRVDGFPVELKTSRANRAPAEDRIQAEFGHYLEQLCVYLVLMNCLKGSLWVLFLNLKDERNRTFPEARCYTVAITEEQFAELETEILRIRDQLHVAIEQRNHRLLPPCRKWKCGPDSCAWWEQCKPEGRYNRPRKDWIV